MGNVIFYDFFRSNVAFPLGMIKMKYICLKLLDKITMRYCVAFFFL